MNDASIPDSFCARGRCSVELGREGPTGCYYVHSTIAPRSSAYSPVYIVLAEFSVRPCCICPWV